MTVRKHPRDELADRRTGVKLQVFVPVQLARLITEAQGRFGVTKKQVVVAALTSHFAAGGQHQDVKELLRLARLWLGRQINGA